MAYNIVNFTSQVKQNFSGFTQFVTKLRFPFKENNTTSLFVWLDYHLVRTAILYQYTLGDFLPRFIYYQFFFATIVSNQFSIKILSYGIINPVLSPIITQDKLHYPQLSSHGRFYPIPYLVRQYVTYRPNTYISLHECWVICTCHCGCPTLYLPAFTLNWA